MYYNVARENDMRERPSTMVTRHTQSASHPDGWQSVLIALVRGIAAVAVVGGHLRALFYPGMRSIVDPPLWFQGFAFFTGFGHQAVLLFFVVSGWLVGGSLLDKWQQPGALANYAIDRVSRLWTVLIPVFVLSLLLALLQGTVSAGAVDLSRENEFSASNLVANLLGLQMIVAPTFGGNFALWSLSNESWYYVLFPLLVVMFRTQVQGWRTLCALLTTLLVCTLPPNLLLFFAIWLLGAGASRIAIQLGRGGRVLIIVLTLCASVYCRLAGYGDDLSTASFFYDLGLSCLFLILLCSLQGIPAPVRPITVRLAATGRFFAEFSFTLYVVHVPLIYLLQHLAARLWGIEKLSPYSPYHLMACLGMLAGIVTVAWLFYLLFEAHTKQVRQWAKRLLLRPKSVSAVAT
jgi:peptidoglycan/LPS O-acetylase OafA/YrhL